MRKGDMEWVDRHSQPLRDSISRLEALLPKLDRRLEMLDKRTKDMKRDHKANTLAIDQACNSARSLLQQANRAAKATKIIEEEVEVAELVPAPNDVRTPDARIASARAANTGRTIL